MKGKLFKVNKAGFCYMSDFSDKYSESERKPIMEGEVVISLEDDSCPFVVSLKTFNGLSMNVDEVLSRKLYSIDAWALNINVHLVEI